MSKVDHAERAHSPVGASSAYRWMTCPGSVELISKHTKSISKESKYAAEGTLAHEYADYCLRNNFDPVVMKDRPMQGMESLGPISQEMAEHVKTYVDFVKSQHVEGADLFIEEKFSLELDKRLYGTNDACIYDPFNELVVIDLKYGAGIPVEAVDNKQLLYYALGAAKDMDISQVRMVIVQPRCDHPDGPIRQWVVDTEYLDTFEKELKKALSKVDECKDLSAKEIYEKYTKAGSHCRFCNHAAKCKTYRNKALETAKTAFDKVEQISVPEPKDMTLEEISKTLNAASLINDWVKQVQEFAHALAEKGEKIPGVKLVEKRANRKWKDETKIIEEFSPLLEDEIYSPRKLKSPAQLEKLIGKEAVKEHTFTPKSGTTLVPESDKRKEINRFSIEEAFNKELL